MSWLLLPAFFAYTGMRTEIGLVSGWTAWLFCALVVLVATLGKFGGSFVAARFTGLNWRISAALGILMNTRGLAFFNWDWLNQDAMNYICSACGRVEWFMPLQ
jgi:Kef-type K+ transport system membrane component KefB